MEILLDFDGTCVAHCYPEVGPDIGAEPCLHKLVEAGHKLILFTMRSHRDKGKLEDKRSGLQQAIDWFEQKEIPLYGIQENPTQKQWTDSPKAYGHLIIDDIAAGVPLLFQPGISPKPFVDWCKMDDWLIESGFYY